MLFFDQMTCDEVDNHLASRYVICNNAAQRFDVISRSNFSHHNHHLKYVIVLGCVRFLIFHL